MNEKAHSNNALEAIARVVHEANRAWCAAHGDASQPTWENAEAWMRDATYAAIEFRTKNPTASAGAQHDQWAAEKRRSGWVYGAVKDAKAKTHPMLVPYEELPEFERRKDSLVAAVIKALTD